MSEETLALDVISAVGPGGNFISQRHTIKNMRKEHYMPTLSDRNDWEDWEAAGSLSAADRAGGIVEDILRAEEKHYIGRQLVERLRAEFPEIALPLDKIMEHGGAE